MRGKGAMSKVHDIPVWKWTAKSHLCHKVEKKKRKQRHYHPQKKNNDTAWG